MIFLAILRFLILQKLWFLLNFDILKFYSLRLKHLELLTVDNLVNKLFKANQTIDVVSYFCTIVQIDLFNFTLYLLIMIRLCDSIQTIEPQGLFICVRIYTWNCKNWQYFHVKGGNQAKNIQSL